MIGSPLEPLTYAAEHRCVSGQVVQAPLRGRQKTGVVLQETEAPDFRCQPLEATEERFSESTMALARFIASYYFCTLGEALALFYPESNLGDLPKPPMVSSVSRPSLSPLQLQTREVLESQPVALLFGDTGSGKTEIYIDLIATALEHGKNALLLMPEISLTPQMEKRLNAYFGDSVAIWHSKISAKKKREVLEGIAKGEVRIIAGARSALFLPLHHVGLIVVDEAHDDSYKSQTRPRYNAKDLAIYFGAQWGAKTVLGTATPLASDWHRYPVARLKGGYFGASRRITFEERLCDISPLLLQKIEERLTKKEQALVFLPTRANFKYLLCGTCGQGLDCPFCSVGLSLHRSSKSLRCHYCGYTMAIPENCPSCESGHFINRRIGTAEVVEQLGQLFPQAVIGKFDRDEITTESKLKTVLKNFNAGKIDILVGTQMLSKGHDYHGVTLAVVLGIDYILHSADYRARERAVSLLLQIAGRAGRKTEGEVLIQTLNAEFFGRFLEDYEALLKEELEFREGAYPPFARLMTIQFAHANDEKARREMEDCLVRLRECEGIEIVGSGKSAIEKIANKHRYGILLRSSSAKKLLDAARQAKTALAQVDMDALQFQ